MPRPVPPSSSDNGAGHNLFVEADPDLASQRPARARAAVPRRVAVRDPRRSARCDELDATPPGRPRPVCPPDGASGPAARRDTRARTAGRGQRPAAAGPNARPALRSLVTLAVVAGLLLALSWVGLALLDALGARQSAQRHQAASVAALGHARAEIQALSVQRDQRDQAAGAARLAALSAQRDQAPMSTRQAPAVSQSQLTGPHHRRQ